MFISREIEGAIFSKTARIDPARFPITALPIVNCTSRQHLGSAKAWQMVSTTAVYGSRITMPVRSVMARVALMDHTLGSDSSVIVGESKTSRSKGTEREY
jgi:hypothetical protein